MKLVVAVLITLALDVTSVLVLAWPGTGRAGSACAGRTAWLTDTTVPGPPRACAASPDRGLHSASAGALALRSTATRTAVSLA
ncbi:MAG: hypothetical protein M3O15_08240, partial [Acidobacteriota bacterium]|nr:hypothetical protein [Acidobacteriota bacterium]